MNIQFRCDPALEPYLPRPVPARRALPDWLKAMPAEAHSLMHDHAVRTVKQCPPFIDAMSAGFLMLLPCDIVYRAGAFSWHWDIPAPHTPGQPSAPLNFHAAAQVSGTPFAKAETNLIKFTSFWTIRLPPGWSLLATHPVNREDLPFRTLTGLVHADLFHAAGINFPALWTAPGYSGVLPRGLPIAQCCAVPREAPVLVCEPMAAAHVAGYDALAEKIMSGPGVYRKGYRRKPGAA